MTTPTRRLLAILLAAAMLALATALPALAGTATDGVVTSVTVSRTVHHIAAGIIRWPEARVTVCVSAAYPRPMAACRYVSPLKSYRVGQTVTVWYEWTNGFASAVDFR